MSQTRDRTPKWVTSFCYYCKRYTDMDYTNFGIEYECPRCNGKKDIPKWRID